MIDPFDDLGTAKKPYRVVACIPVKGRAPLVEQTIKRLYWKNGVYRVICVGDDLHDRKVCEKAGAVWVQFNNKPLGAKWNAAFEEAKKYEPDACLYVGSSDWLSGNWIDFMRPHVDEHHLVGAPGMYLVDSSSKGLRGVYWPGYNLEKRNESIGIGRMLSRELLDRMKWCPFEGTSDRSLDRSMTDKCARFGFKEFMLQNPQMMALSLSFPERWPNKHIFDMHWNGLLPSQKIDPVPFMTTHFPEIFEIEHAGIRQ